jgi:sigma-E factor negative regulatory protein RseC
VREVGSVISVKDDAVVVAMPMSGACDKCGMCIATADRREVLLLAKNGPGASVGDSVEIEIAASKVIAAAFIVYMVPVFMTIIGFFVGGAVAGPGDSELPIVTAVVFLVLSFVGVWLYDLKLRKVERRQAVVTRILTDEETKNRRRVQTVSLGGE